MITMENKIAKKEKVIDFDSIIANSNNRFLKSLPRFLINIIKGILCQDQLNEIHNNNKDRIGIDYVNGILSDLDVEVRMHNEQNIRKEGRYIFVANHPLGGVDALAFLSCINKLTGDVISPSNELFNHVSNLQPLIVGVNVFGKNNKTKSEAISKAFAGNAAIMIFPAGKVSRKSLKGISDLEWHKSFISKAIQTQREVVPVFISGRNSEKFYRVARLRKFLGIKMTIETMYLPHEMFRKRGSRIDLIFGNPIAYTFFDKSRNPHDWAQYVKSLVYEMGQGISKEN